VRDVPDEELPATLADLGGHDIDGLIRILDAADADRTRASIVFAYTIKGWRLPFAGDSLNHSAHLLPDQVDQLGRDLGIDPDDVWAGFAADSPSSMSSLRRTEPGYDTRAKRSRRRSHRDRGAGRPDRRGDQHPAGVRRHSRRWHATRRSAVASSPRPPTSRSRRTSVAGSIGPVSSSDGGRPDRHDVKRPLVWEPARPVATSSWHQRDELCSCGSASGLSGELFGERLAPIGSVYDPFIARGLDAITRST
jgi:pyruvate dehydrogenase E1 component